MCAPRVTRHTSIRYSSSYHTRVNIGASIFFTAVMIRAFRSARSRMVLSVGGSFAYFARNVRCTVTTDLLVWCSNTQNDFSTGAAIFPLHTLASPSAQRYDLRWKTAYWGKNFLSCSFYLYRFRKYVSYGFPIINFCNRGAHYVTPCITDFPHQF